MGNGSARMGRSCSRTGCRQIATKTLTYIYADSVAVLGPLATFAEPHAYDLCEVHSQRMSVPRGWTVIKQEPETEQAGPSSDDLMAIADAIREAGSAPETRAANDGVVRQPIQNDVGRRGHLRAIPN